MRVLLFGSDGQLGRELTALAAHRGVALTGLNRAAVDITDPVAVARAVDAAQPDIVVNTAAYTAVDKAESEPDLAARVNARAPGLIAERCARNGTPLIHISTDYVFDGTKVGAYVETDPIAPLGVYGHTKAAGEAAVRAAGEKHLILRTAWVYGVYGNNFLKTMLRLAKERDRLTIVADQRGCPTCTRDIAEGILAAAAKSVEGKGRWGTYHLGGTGVTTWHGFAQEIISHAGQTTGRTPEVAPITTADYPTPAKRPANSELNSRLFERTFGFRAAAWQQRVTEVVDALLAPTPAEAP
ncbi:NAD(P)-dependent oxidoreductase [Azorhizobium oxalatiphilum]|uniref:dTDP-4-dehydrorhamnose reductase n=1 Tax=Azorhizobium oxalatiphilum TaxID=980631 RepID=A0A917FAD5_9HYPH|nr:dTDP-4-dehydrorhamnose reductase [Azorhizobium oxalatiphilum]GGF62057.1 NAD(P)-dependent oxidoreductase [Azorhizobium oxalatiphilum]